MGTALCYTKEHAVLYFEQQGNNDDDYKFSDSYLKENYYSHTFQLRYTPIKPVVFGVGDIVEVQASFMAVPPKQGKFKSIMVLRGSLNNDDMSRFCVNFHSATMLNKENH